MARGRLGGPRPFANDELMIQFSILTTPRLGRSVTQSTAINFTDPTGNKQVLDAVEVTLEEDDRYSGTSANTADADYDTRTNNLNIVITLDTFGLTLNDIEELVREVYDKIASGVEAAEGITMKRKASDNPPKENEFQLINQGGLAENIHIQ